MPHIKDIYELSAGSLVDAIYSGSRGERHLGTPSHNYDFACPSDWADAHGFYPDARGHRDDRVKKPAHPTHSGRGAFRSLYQFDLTGKGMEDPNYTLFGLADGGQDPQAVMTYKDSVVLPEITVTPKGSYIHNPYDNIDIFCNGGAVRPKAKGGTESKRENAYKRYFSDLNGYYNTPNFDSYLSYGLTPKEAKAATEANMRRYGNEIRYPNTDYAIIRGYDLGTLPEVVVRPDAGTEAARMKMHRMFPNTGQRTLRDIAFYSNKYSIPDERLINNLYDINIVLNNF